MRANRTSIILTSLFTLSIVARYGSRPIDILDRVPATQSDGTGGSGVLDQLGGTNQPAPPAGSDPAAAPPADSAAPAAPVAPAAPAAPEVPNQ